MAHGADVPWELFVWELVEDTGWTLEYIDSLPFGKIHERLQVIDGRNKANAELRNKGK